MIGILLVAAPLPAEAAAASDAVPVRCSVGGGDGLIDAIRAAERAGGGALELAGHCTYTLTKPDNRTDGANGLPVLTGRVTITGKAGTRIARASAAGTPDFRIVEVAKHATVAIAHVTITGGVSDAGRDGAGVENKGTITSLTDDTIRGNSSSGGGGGVDNVGKITDFTHDTISNNHAAGLGGGVLNVGGRITSFTDDTVAGNTAAQGGAGIANLAGFIDTLRHCTVSHNHVTKNLSGGGIFNRFGTMAMSDDTISHNTADAGFAAGGGGIDNSGSAAKLTLTDSVVSHNVARGTGGGIDNDGTAVSEIRATKVIDNTVTSPRGPAVGGGIYNGARMSLADSTVRHNQARTQSGRAVAAGIYNLGVLSVTHTGITGNVVDSQGGEAEGGGLYVDEGSHKTRLENSTVTNNRALGAHPHGAGIFFAGGAPVVLANSVVATNVPENCYPAATVGGCSATSL